MNLKNIFCVIAVFAVILFMQGCSRPGENVRVPSGFEFVADISYNDTKITAEIFLESTESCSINITKPTVLKGMAVTWNGVQAELSYMGLKKTLDTSQFPQTAFIPSFFDVLSGVSSGNIMPSSNKQNELVYQGQCSTGEFTATADGKSGALTRVEVPSIGFSADIRDFKSHEQG